MLKDYLGKPDELLGVGLIYPIKIKDYERFNYLASKYLAIGENYLANKLKVKDMNLLDYWVWLCTLPKEESNVGFFISELEELFELTLGKKVNFNDCGIFNNEYKDVDEVKEFVKITEYYFDIENGEVSEDGYKDNINKFNFCSYRNIVCRQNLIFEVPTSPYKRTQRNYEKRLEVMSKNNTPLSLESMCATVVIKKGLNIKEVFDYTIYQLKLEYEMIDRIEFRSFAQLIKSQGGECEIPSLGEPLKSIENPYADFLKKFNPTEMERNAFENQNKGEYSL